MINAARAKPNEVSATRKRGPYKSQSDTNCRAAACGAPQGFERASNESAFEKQGASDCVPVAGVTPLTTVDYPEHLATVVFLPGCPWRCPYCHNPALQKGCPPGDWSWTRVCELLNNRCGLIEAAVFSGGEPTMHRGLPEALREVRAMGFLTGLHTAGIYPDRLATLLPLLNWVGLDIKAPLDQRYTALTGDPTSLDKIQQSLSVLAASGKPYQLRTTTDGVVCTDTDYHDLCQQLAQQHWPPPVRQTARQPEPVLEEVLV